MTKGAPYLHIPLPEVHPLDHYSDLSCLTLEEARAIVMQKLIDEGEIFYCAGGLMIEHPLIQPYIDRIEGTLDSIMGLSKSLVLELLEKM